MTGISPPRAALWLLFDESAGAAIAAQIQALADACSAPLFPPHLTLLSGLPDQRTGLCAQLVPHVRGLVLHSTGARWGESFYQCIFLAVAPADALLSARRAAERRSQRHPTPFMPHISLLYSDMPHTERAAICAQLPALPQSIPVSALALVRTSGPATGWVERERVLAR